MMKAAENPLLIGHRKAERDMLHAMESGRMHHAWLISGPEGIGKTTFALHAARHLLTGGKAEQNMAESMLFAPEPAEKRLQTNLDTPAAARMAARSHGDFMMIDGESAAADSKRKTQDIGVEQIRGISRFLALTPAESAWRVVLIDEADSMNGAAANALLKGLEEPPAHSVLLLVSHRPARLLPTIRSRCRHLPLGLLGEEDFRTVIEHALPAAKQKALADPAWDMPLSFCAGRPGLALRWLEQDAATLYGELAQHLGALRAADIDRWSTLGDSVATAKQTPRWHLLCALLQRMIAETIRLHAHPGGHNTSSSPLPWAADWGAALATPGALAKWAEIWQRIHRLIADTNRINLSRKHTLIMIFYLLHQSLKKA